MNCCNKIICDAEIIKIHRKYFALMYNILTQIQNYSLYSVFNKKMYNTFIQ